MSENHEFLCIGGRYVCQADNCDYDTLNVWCAEAHFVENASEDVDTAALDAPDWLLDQSAEEA